MPALQAFAQVIRCELVVTQPDRAAGRGKKLQATPVKRAARALGISTIEPERLREAYDTLRDLDADVFAVASYGKIVPQAILDLAPRGALNVHPSLLPLYRGATPVQAQLRDGIRETGVTIIAMDAGMDTGDIVAQRASAIAPEETYGELHDRLALVGAEMLAHVCDDLTRGPLVRIAQSGRAEPADIARTTTRPLRKDEWRIGSVSGAQTVGNFANFVRSLAPSPAARIAFAQYDNVKIFAAHALSAPGPALADAVSTGDVVVAQGTILVRASDGWLEVDVLALPGGKTMSAAAFRNGYPFSHPKALESTLHAWAQARSKVAS